MWKSNNPQVFWKLQILFVIKRSLHRGFKGLLKQGSLFTRFFASELERNSDKCDSVSSKSTSATSNNLPYFWQWNLKHVRYSSNILLQTILLPWFGGR